LKKYYIVYQTTNLINEKIYIGIHSTNILEDRYLGSGTLLLRAIKKYGRLNFERKILFIYDNPDEMVVKEKEIVNIDFLRREDTYNCVIGGRGIGNLGKKLLNPRPPMKEETKQKIREKRKLQVIVISDETKQKISIATKGKSKPAITEDHKHRISLANKGRQFSEIHKENISKAKDGVKIKPHTEQHKENIRNGTKGINRGPQSAEHIKKLSEVRKGRRLSEERKQELRKIRQVRKIQIINSLIFGIIEYKQFVGKNI